MKRILIIGSPGSGKSTLAFELKRILNFPILHLDRVFHIDNYHSISRDKLLKEILNFVNEHHQFIIDGNYSSTLRERLLVSDTVIVMNFNTDICMENIEKRRLSNEERLDMAPGFDNSIKHEEFYDYVRHFKSRQFPNILNILADFPDVRKIHLKTYDDVKNFLENIKKEN
jgi:adenylate kinase family enzyme